MRHTGTVSTLSLQSGEIVVYGRPRVFKELTIGKSNPVSLHKSVQHLRIAFSDNARALSGKRAAHDPTIVLLALLHDKTLVLKVEEQKPQRADLEPHCTGQITSSRTFLCRGEDLHNHKLAVSEPKTTSADLTYNADALGVNRGKFAGKANGLLQTRTSVPSVFDRVLCAHTISH